MMERSYSGFYRCMALPMKINPEKVDTSFKNGMLEIRMPKLEPKKRMKEIRIK